MKVSSPHPPSPVVSPRLNGRGCLEYCVKKDSEAVMAPRNSGTSDTVKHSSVLEMKHGVYTHCICLLQGLKHLTLRIYPRKQLQWEEKK